MTNQELTQRAYPTEVKSNSREEHPSAQVGETTYRVRWYGQDAKGDTFEPIRHIPRNKVISYYKRKKLSLPDDIDQAQMA